MDNQRPHAPPAPLSAAAATLAGLPPAQRKAVEQYTRLVVGLTVAIRLGAPDASLDRPPVPAGLVSIIRDELLALDRFTDHAARSAH